MVKTDEDLEAFLNKLERRFEKLENGTFLVGMGADQAPVAIKLAPPVLVAQVRIGPAPTHQLEQEAKLFRRLLELNATDLLHASYGLERNEIVLSAALELETLDLNELEAVLADIALALGKHVSVLLEMVQKK